MSVGCEGGDIDYNIKLDVTDTVANIAELNKLWTTYLSLVRRAGLPENIVELMSQIQQLRVMIETTYRSLMILYAASGPIGWLIGFGGLALSTFMMADMMEARRPQY